MIVTTNNHAASIGDLIAKTDTSVRSDSVEEMHALLQNAKETTNMQQLSSGTYGGSIGAAGHHSAAAFN